MKIIPSTFVFLALAAGVQAGPQENLSQDVPPITYAEEPDSKMWFRAAPYAWGTWVEGDVGVGNLTAPVDITLSDVVDNLDMTYMGVLEAGYDRWSLGVDLFYAKLSSDITGGGRAFKSFRFEQKQWVTTPAVSYRVLDTQNNKMSLLGGARITSLEMGLTGRFAGGGQTSQFRSRTWVDPIVGIKGQYDFNEKYFLRYNGDIGGFGVSSELSWQAFVGLGYNVSENFSIALGYRGLGSDYERRGFVYDVITHGPVIGFEFRF